MSYYWPQLKTNEFPKKYDIETALKTVNISNREDIMGRNLSACINALIKETRTKGISRTRQIALRAYSWDLFPKKNKSKSDLEQIKNRNETNIDKLRFWQADISLFGALLIKVENQLVENKETVLKLTRIENTDFDKIDENRFKIYDDDGKATIIEYNENSTDWIYITDGEIEVGGIYRNLLRRIVDLNELSVEWLIISKRLKGVPVTITDTTELVKQASAIGLKDEQIQKALNDLQYLTDNLGKENALSAINTMKGNEVNFQALADAAAAAAIDLHIKSLQSDISIAILGQANTTELPANGGSRAALQVLNLIRQDILFSDMLTTQTLINRYLKIDSQFNKQTMNIDYKFDFIYDDVIDTESNANKFSILAGANMKFPIKKAEFYEQIGNKMPEKDIPEEDLIYIGGSTMPQIDFTNGNNDIPLQNTDNNQDDTNTPIDNNKAAA